MVGEPCHPIIRLLPMMTCLAPLKTFDPDETRTRNLLIRSQTPYPLGHEATEMNR